MRTTCSNSTSSYVPSFEGGTAQYPPVKTAIEKIYKLAKFLSHSSLIFSFTLLSSLYGLQIKMLDGEKTKLNSEVNDLQNRVARDEEREEEARKESFGLKQKVSSWSKCSTNPALVWF